MTRLIIYAVLNFYKSSGVQLFMSLQPQNGKVNGTTAKDYMVKTKLPYNILGKIWKLADIDLDGCLDSDEFALASYLIRLKLEGEEIPGTLPEHLVPPLKRTLVASRTAGDSIE